MRPCTSRSARTGDDGIPDEESSVRFDECEALARRRGAAGQGQRTPQDVPGPEFELLLLLRSLLLRALLLRSLLLGSHSRSPPRIFRS